MLLIELQRRAFKSPDFWALATLSATIVCIGAVFFHNQEGLPWIDAFYFCVITLTTVGYGDFSPQTPGGKLFTIFYVIAGLGIVAGLIGTIANLATEIAQEKREK
ncbi:MAG: voltage-gated potassium channel [Myxococcota bacterium]|jgi:voltage-gated potassium channel